MYTHKLSDVCADYTWLRALHNTDYNMNKFSQTNLSIMIHTLWIIIGVTFVTTWLCSMLQDWHFLEVPYMLSTASLVHGVQLSDFYSELSWPENSLASLCLRWDFITLLLPLELKLALGIWEVIRNRGQMGCLTGWWRHHQKQIQKVSDPMACRNSSLRSIKS